MPLPASYGGGAIVSTGEGFVVILDSRLRQAERRAALAHELVHAERGVLPRSAPEHVRAKEEKAVRREVAERLVPDTELAAFVRRCLTLDMSVTAEDVAEEFSVPLEVAELACRRAS